MAKHNRVCMSCGKEYSYCPTCGSYQNQPTWKNAFCSKDCADIFEAASLYYANKIDESDMIEALKRTVDIERKDSYEKGIKKLIEKYIINEVSADSTIDEVDDVSGDSEGKVSDDVTVEVEVSADVSEEVIEDVAEKVKSVEVESTTTKNTYNKKYNNKKK